MSLEQEVERLRRQLEAADERLAELYQMASLGRLVTHIVHEINTPIGSVRSNNEVVRKSLEVLGKLLAKSPAPDPKALEILDTLRSLAEVDRIACDRISAIIRSLKTYARVDQGDLRKVDLNQILADAIKLGGCEYKRRVSVETHFADLPEVECYPQLMSQVFLNLLVNAGQAIEGEGRITVRTLQENGWVHISVADTGRGIPVEARSRIFQPGFTTKAPGVGTGLGLAISRKIVVEVHGGSIDFESPAGAGATFHVRIPIQHPKKES